MASTPEDQQPMTLRAVTLELQTFHSFGGLTFRHRRQPLTFWCVFLLVFLTLDTVIEAVFAFVLEYDEQLFFAVGHISAYIFGAKYRYFPILFFYKVIGLLTLVIHVTSDYGWIELVDNQLDGLDGRAVVTAVDMAKVVRNSKLITRGSIQFCIAVALFAFNIQTFLFHFGRLSWYYILPTGFTFYFVMMLHTYIQWCLLGQYYLLLSYCFHLVRVGTRNLVEAITNADDHIHIEQALADFEVIASCVHQVWQYTSKIILVYLIIASCMIPVYIFDTVYADISIFMKLLLVGCALYMLVIVGFLSYLPGPIDAQLEPVADQLYRSIITKGTARYFSDLRYKYLKFELHALNGLGLCIAGYRINLSTCISLTTVYVTVFSLLIHSRSSVGRIEFVQ